MAFHLQNIYGTEQDRVNCPFYFKIGACRHGERCTRLHNKPTESQTLIIMNMYQTPYNQYGPNSEPLFDPKAAQSHFDDFYQDLFLELAQIGEIEEIYVCRNLGDHLVGNVYVKFYEEETALKALEAVRGRYYNGKPLVAELSPVTDFREARCRQYDVGECQRGGYCNFMHLTEPSRDVAKELIDWQRKMWRKRRREARAAARAERRKKEQEDRDKKDIDRSGEGYGDRESEKRRRSRSSSREHKRRKHDDERERDKERERERDRERKERDRDRRREREGRDSRRRGERERDKDTKPEAERDRSDRHRSERDKDRDKGRERDKDKLKEEEDKKEAYTFDGIAPMVDGTLPDVKIKEEPQDTLPLEAQYQQFQ